MQAHFRGFQMTPGFTPLADVFREISTGDYLDVEFRGHYRDLYVLEDSTHVYGLVLTITDQKGFCQVRTGEDGLSKEVVVSQLEDGNQFAEFNYFVILKSTWRGVYQHYSGSCGIGTFGAFIRDISNDIDKQSKEEEIKEAEARPGKTKAVKAIRKKFKDAPKFAFTELLTNQDADQLINAMQSVSKMQYKMATVQSLGASVAPLSEFVQKQQIALTFSKDGGVLGKLKSGVVQLARRLRGTTSLVADLDIDDLVVSGLDENGHPVSYSITRNFQRFHSCDFESIVNDVGGTATASNLTQNKIVKTLLAIMKKNPAYFSAPDAV